MHGIAWPSIPHLTGNILLALLFQFEKSQWWPPERLRDALHDHDLTAIILTALAARRRIVRRHQRAEDSGIMVD